MFTVVTAFCILDWRDVTRWFGHFIAWVRLNPYSAIVAIILLYTVSITFTLPTTCTHIMLGFTYSQVFQSQIKGFLFTVPIVEAGCLCGALSAFLLSRYLFKSFIKEQISHSEWLSSNFRAIDELLVTQGAQIVALVRVTFAPFGLTSYLLGVTSISIWQFIIGTSSYLVNVLM